MMDWCWIIVSIVISLWIKSCSSLQSKTFYMDYGNDCSRTYVLAGATVFSHNTRHNHKTNTKYPNGIDCQLTFEAPHVNWRLMLVIEYLDIPDISFGLCDDALYIYDADSVFGYAFTDAGGASGLCGNEPPSVIYSSTQFLTIFFRTDLEGASGRGFKLTITAFTEADQFGSCSDLFTCSNGRCIDADLVCDAVDHCTDLSDEARDGDAECGKFEGTFLKHLLSGGIIAAVAITVGSVVVILVCSVCMICCCCRCLKKGDQDPGGGGTTTTTTTTATHVTINNGGPPPSEKLYDMVPGSYQHTGYNQHGYHSMNAAHVAPASVTYSPFTQQRESYTHSQGTGSLYSSCQGPAYAPPSYHRSYTPTSSRSGRSHHSNDSNHVKYTISRDAVNM